MENVLGFIPCPAIVIIVYMIGAAAKNIDAIDDKWIPCICGIAGAPLGLLAMRLVPDFAASDPLTAIAIGIASGLAATGVNQIIKQQRKTE